MFSPTAICRPDTDLHLNVCVREVVLWRQLPIVVDEVVEDRWAEHWLRKQIRQLHPTDQSSTSYSVLKASCHFFLFQNHTSTHIVHNKLKIHQKNKEQLTVSTIHHSYLCIQEDDSLLCDEEINACALVSSSFLDFLSLGSEYITPVQTNIHYISLSLTALVQLNKNNCN